MSGVLGARTSPRVMLAGGLIATAAVNIAFGAGNSMPWFLTFWAINGILQVQLQYICPVDRSSDTHAACALASDFNAVPVSVWGILGTAVR